MTDSDDHFSPGQVAWLVGLSPHTPKVCGFNYQSEHIPRLQF